MSGTFNGEIPRELHTTHNKEHCHCYFSKLFSLLAQIIVDRQIRERRAKFIGLTEQ